MEKCSCGIADGARVISDFRVMGDQRELFGPVASVPTAWRALKEAAVGGDRRRRKITDAVGKARRHAWARGKRRRLMITCDGAGASHALVEELDRLAGRHGYQVTYSVGWELAARERAVIAVVPRPPGRAPSTAGARSASAAPMMPAGARGAGRRLARGLAEDHAGGDRGTPGHPARQPGQGPPAKSSCGMSPTQPAQPPSAGPLPDGWRRSNPALSPIPRSRTSRR
jgi:hypothetical protein